MLCNVWNTALRSYVLSDLPFATTAAAPRLQCKNLVSLQSPLNVATNRYSFAEKRTVLVHAATDAVPKRAVKIEEMSLSVEAKDDHGAEGKMKLAKKLRQRRKRLVRKRRLRKKGRWQCMNNAYGWQWPIFPHFIDKYIVLTLFTICCYSDSETTCKMCVVRIRKLYKS
jgi:50S ribosomal protein 5